MIRITRLTDYAIVLLVHMAQEGKLASFTASHLARGTHLPAPTVSKLLKVLCRAGLLLSQRGVQGGYRLARDPKIVTVSQIITAVEGPIAITECSQANTDCEHAASCSVQDNWQRINGVLHRALDGITLRDMIGPLQTTELVQLGLGSRHGSEGAV